MTRNRDRRALADLARRAKESRSRLPDLVSQIHNLVRRVDPIELLSQLTVLFQMHSVNEQPDWNTSAAWHVRIEWLAWLVFSEGVEQPSRPEMIGQQILEPLQHLLDEYVAGVATTLPEPVEALSEDANELRMLLQLEALFVRGEAPQAHLETLGIELFSPHDEWCVANIGCSAKSAYVMAEALFSLLSEKLDALRVSSDAVRERILADPVSALELGLPLPIRDALGDANAMSDRMPFADSVAKAWFFANTNRVVGFTVDEVQQRLAGQFHSNAVAAFLDLLSIDQSELRGEATLLQLSPVARTPLIRYEGRLFMFVPALLYGAILYAFHARLFGDPDYRAVYDEARAKWLERSTIEVFRRMLPASESGWGLNYGPKRTRLEIDGLIKYANKLILVECKWKRPTLLGRSGDVAAALNDVTRAILDPLAQLRRARSYVAEREMSQFTERTTGQLITVRRSEVAEIVLVTVVGTTAWSFLAANLIRLVPLGYFADGELPWALNLNDLRVVADCLDLPSQLFDYLRRRAEVQKDSKWFFHDEWDLLSAYLAGALDTKDPRVAEVDGVMFDGFDTDLQAYYYERGTSERRLRRPRRPIPSNLFRLLDALDQEIDAVKSDAICVVLSWPNEGLERLGALLDQARQKALADGRAHAVAVAHPWRSSGVVFACGTGDESALKEVLWTACESQRLKIGATEMVGFAIDLSNSSAPFVLYFNQAKSESQA